ncbi:hypothetical protein FNF29_05440 [Cafeteria roenbergensis]|uniref:Uncharacterized protein n=1 Tax=Cafeteria roenbergensis TaxID=33653 RepID=A0A5A8CDR0_CAFRO|nr:hypothetical protein FNF29_05440 [Cafeteria roenbergensis]|eukprot:KAA0150200.1 hypothetical protein FNF29_05440 [Cafeteria roenbergensis]
MSAEELGKALWDASYAGDEAEVLRLIDAGAPANWTTSSWGGSTPLMLAVWNENADTVRLLLERGADVDTTDNGGKTALDMGEDEVCREVLLDAERIQRWHRRRLLVAWKQ